MDEDRFGTDGDLPGDIGDNVPPEEVLDALADGATRDILRYLGQHESSSLERLATVLAGVRASRSGPITKPAEYQRIRVQFHHVVLPKLQSLGYLTYDADSRTVTDADVPPQIQVLLDSADRPTDQPP